MTQFIVLILVVLTVCGVVFYVHEKDNRYEEQTYEHLTRQYIDATLVTISTDWGNVRKTKNMEQKILYVFGATIAVIVLLLLCQIYTLWKLHRISKSLNKISKETNNFEREYRDDKWKKTEEENWSTHNGYRRNTACGQSSKMKGHQEEPTKKESNDFEEVYTSSSGQKNNSGKEFLKPNSGDKNFFWKGSAVDQSGAMFLVTYDNTKEPWKGQLNIMPGLDMSNLKTIDSTFFYKVIKAVDSKINLKDATGFIQKEPGIVEFDSNDNVWKILKQVTIKLV